MLLPSSLASLFAWFLTELRRPSRPQSSIKTHMCSPVFFSESSISIISFFHFYQIFAPSSIFTTSLTSFLHCIRPSPHSLFQFTPFFLPRKTNPYSASQLALLLDNTSMGKKRKSVYAISIGRNWGFRTDYNDVLQETHQYPGAEFAGFQNSEEAREWMEEPRRTKRRDMHLARLEEESDDEHVRSQLEAEVKALNDKIVLKTAAKVTANEKELNDIPRGATSTLSSSPSSSPPPSSSSRCSRCSGCSCSSSPSDDLPSSPPSTKPVKTTSSPASD
ncbi:hypothetical protein FMEXI_899 [Fusarium mexicanum]|uniref:Ribonuclease H1 N-terminal domain-containing protein n=1 Tax=Fusarium mexicanum TaxID=751941 RepID=A0A8H5JPG9_9HYPO|nr:hypothetical protein FMEXI_899 [Fusarium mexicanum]